MLKTTGERRAAAIAKMSAAIVQGKSRAAFMRELQTTTGGYRKTTFLADWAIKSGIEQKKDVVKYVRRGYFPTAAIVEAKGWKLEKEYMYKMQVKVRLRPGEPIETRFRNVMTDVPITREEAEARIEEMWAEKPEKVREEITGIMPVGIISRETK